MGISSQGAEWRGQWMENDEEGTSEVRDILAKQGDEMNPAGRGHQ